MSIVIKRSSRIAIAMGGALLLTMLMASAAFAQQTNEQNAQNDAYADNVSTAISGDANAGILSNAQSGDANARSSSSQRQSIQQNQIGVNVGDCDCEQTNRQNARNTADAFNDSLAASGNANAGILSNAESGDADARSSSRQRQRIEQNQIGVNVQD